MSAFTCPGCGSDTLDEAQVCAKCGWSRYRPSAATLSIPGGTAIGVGTATHVTLPLFPVATHKFILMTICSFGIYELYWSYQNWKRISDASNEAISPLWRAIFCPFWGFSLFGRVEDLAAEEGIVTRWSATILAAVYLILHLLWRLPDPWSWISLASFVPMLPVQMTAQRINRTRLGLVSEDLNTRYTAANITLLCVGGLMFLLALLGTLIPE